MKKFYANKNRAGFTLAEVLITLGIIGVVAALTIPTLIGNYQKQATVNRLKKVYSEFAQAIRKSEMDYGLMETWDFANFNTPQERVIYFGENYLFPSIKTIEKCVPTSNKCWPDNIKNASGNVINDQYISNSNENRNSFITASGYSVFYWMHGSGDGMWYWVDLNGPQKGPNKLGRDIFAFIANWGQWKQIFFFFFLSSVTTREELKAHCDKKQSSNDRLDGDFCAGLIMYDGWKISDDYPW